MALSGFESWLSFKINIPGGKKSHIDICIHTANGHIQFGMICKDLVRGLSQFYEWGNDLVFLVKLMFCHVNAAARVLKFFTIHPMSCFGIEFIFLCERTVVDLF